MRVFIQFFRSIIELLALIALLSLIFPVGYFVLNKDKFNIIEEKNITRQNSGVVSYIINLDDAKTRYSHIKPYVDSVGFNVERISAVRGDSLSEEYLASVIDESKYSLYVSAEPKLGTVGCYLSHLDAWKRFLESNYEFAVIFEDDVSFDPNLLKETIERLVEKKNLWDVVTFEISHNGLPITIETLPNGQNLSVYLTEISHTGAYIINRESAKNLLEKSLPIKMPIDHYFTRSWEFGLKFAGIENPRIVFQTFGDSEIAKTGHVQKIQKTIAQSIMHPVYKLQSYLIRFLYNLKVAIVSFLS